MPHQNSNLNLIFHFKKKWTEFNSKFRSNISKFNATSKAELFKNSSFDAALTRPTLYQVGLVKIHSNIPFHYFK